MAVGDAEAMSKRVGAPSISVAEMRCARIAVESRELLASAGVRLPQALPGSQLARSRREAGRPPKPPGPSHVPFVPQLERTLRDRVRHGITRSSDSLGSAPVFRFALINAADGDALGQVAFARADVKPGEVIPQGRGRNLRVVNVVAPERDGELPLLVVEVTELD